MEKVIIFGTGQMADETYEIMSGLESYGVIAFADNDCSKWGMKKNDLPVLSAESLRGFSDAVIVIASSYYADISIQLQEMGINLKYYESIQSIIGRISPKERQELKAYLKQNSRVKTSYYNLDYEYKDVSKWNDHENREKKYLIICNGGYPTPDNPRGAFVHRRVLQYIEQGLKAEVFGCIENQTFETYEYEGVKVFQGGMLELRQFIIARSYEKLLIHFVDKNIMYAIWRSGRINMPIIIWCHGYEVMRWNRIYYCYSDSELEKNKKNWDKRDQDKNKFFKKIFLMDNIQFVFVSNWLKERVKKSVGILPIHCEVIPNFIDGGFYRSEPKRKEDRLKILCIKSHSTKTYANDITAKAILELSDREFFKELTFDLYGDGELFETNFSELKKKRFPNVFIHRGYIGQNKIRELFADHGILLSPTRCDTQGVTSCEGMSAGMVVISCNTAAVPEFISEDCGSLYEFDNYMQLADEIAYLYDHPEEFVKKGKNAAARMEKQCGLISTVQKELKLIAGM